METAIKVEQSIFSQRHLIALAGSLTHGQYDFLDLYRQLGMCSTNAVDVQAFIAVLFFAECAKSGVSLPAATNSAIEVIHEGLVYLACDSSRWHVTGTPEDKLRFNSWLNAGSEFDRRFRAQDLFTLRGRTFNRFLAKIDDGTLQTSNDGSELFQNAASGSTTVIDVHGLANRLKAFRKAPLFMAVPQSL